MSKMLSQLNLWHKTTLSLLIIENRLEEWLSWIKRLVWNKNQLNGAMVFVNFCNLSIRIDLHLKALELFSSQISNISIITKERSMG